MFSVRCRAYSGLESGKLENKSEDHELGDDDDVVDDNAALKFVRNRLLSFVIKHVFFYLYLMYDYVIIIRSRTRG